MLRTEEQIKLEVATEGLEERLSDMRMALDKLEPITSAEAMGVLFQLNGLLQYLKDKN